MNISKEQLSILTDYAKIDLNENDSLSLQKELNKSVESFEAVKDVDTSDIQPLVGIHELKNVFREDIIENDNEAENQGFALKNVPSKKDGFVVVPKILE